MDCETVRELSANYAAEDVIDTLRSRIDSHLAQCAACAKLYRRERALSARLRALPAPATPSAWFTERLLDRLARDNDAVTERASAFDPSQLSFREI